MMICNLNWEMAPCQLEPPLHTLTHMGTTSFRLESTQVKLFKTEQSTKTFDFIQSQP
jgi:hypothetical protein